MTGPANLAAALVAFQAEMPTVHKSKTAKVPTKAGGSYSYTFADLVDVSAAAVPLLTKHGLAFTCTPRLIPDTRSYELAGVLLHTSGERIEGSLPLYGSTPQELGSGITYGRRYLLGCLTGIVTDDDEDGNVVQQTQAPRTESRDVWSGPSAVELVGLIEDHATRAGKSLEEITAKFRESNGGIGVDGLVGVPAPVLAALEGQIGAFLRKNPSADGVQS